MKKLLSIIIIVSLIIVFSGIFSNAQDKKKIDKQKTENVKIKKDEVKKTDIKKDAKKADLKKDTKKTEIKKEEPKKTDIKKDDTKKIKKDDKEIQTGPRGGKYYINDKGNKIYIKKK
jgi:colicin import membrane protein